MVTQNDMGTIAQITKDSKAAKGGQGPSSMGAPAPKGDAKLDPNAVANPLAEGLTTNGPADITPDTSKGLGTMAPQDKLNMITKMYRGMA